MAEFTAADVKRLRDATGAGMMDCKKALTEADGDYDKAVEFLRVKGAKDVGKRLERSTTNGIVVSKDGALLELDCETDFVAKNADFVKLAERLLDIALQAKPADAEALLATENVTLNFTPDGITRLAQIAYDVNERTENIGARRLSTVMERLLEWVAFTPLQNATGDPAISLPMGTSSKGLPVGVQLAAAQGHDRRLLELAYELEEAQPFARIQD